MAPIDPRKYKLFPRNLTARAHEVVRGNPVTSRPEDGVENCFPGLEFDQRNLDKVFFPGITVELHHDLGIILRDVHPASPAAEFITPNDIATGFFLVFMEGLFPSRRIGVPPAPDIYEFRSPAGLGAWRIIRDLEPGPVAIALCDRATYIRLTSIPLDIERSVTVDTFKEWLDQSRTDRVEEVSRFGRFVLLFGNRARFLTPDGVIDPALVPPGDLTRSLCSPWQYDFADCGCFYWASNKPDLVSSPAQPDRVLNFQRRDRSPQSDQAATPESWILQHNYRWDRREHALNHAEMMQRWQELPFVVDGREANDYTPPQPALLRRILSRNQIIDRLIRLAPVEHALAVEYLYAYYSLAQLTKPSQSASTEDFRIFHASEDVFKVAIDEMRHLRLVNEILLDMGERWVLSRANIIGEDFDGDGIAFSRPYELQPLTSSQLAWFIDVERVSQKDDENSIDGMYTLLLRSIEASNEFTSEQKGRIGPLVKIIIDEGADHFRRFTRVKEALAGLSEQRYLSVRTPPQDAPAGSPERILQDTADAAYVVVLRSLDYVFQLGDRQRGTMLEASRRAMFNMDDAARALALRAIGNRFNMATYRPAAEDAVRPFTDAATPRASVLHAMAGAVGNPLAQHMTALRAVGDPNMTALADRMEERLINMTKEFENAARANK